MDIFRYIEGVSGCSGNGFLRSCKVNELACFVYKGLNNLLEFGFSGFRICCPNPIASSIASMAICPTAVAIKVPATKQTIAFQSINVWT